MRRVRYCTRPSGERAATAAAAATATTWHTRGCEASRIRARSLWGCDPAVTERGRVVRASRAMLESLEEEQVYG